MSIKEYATKNKISIFNVMKMVKSQQLSTISETENGKEVVYIIDEKKSPKEDSSKEIQTAHTPSLEDDIKALQEEVKKLRSEVNTLKVTIFKMAKKDAKILKI